MLRGYRRYLVAVAGLALLVAGVWYGLSRQAEYEEQAANRHSDYARSASYQIEQVCPAGVPDPATCIEKAQSEYDLKDRDNEREYADLAAQQTSALWTSLMGVAALVGMFLSAVGIGLVWTTFRETKRTADAAFHANEIARISNERQLRAYVGVVDFRIHGLMAGGVPTFAVQYKNVGQSPARDLLCRLYVKTDTADPDSVRFEKMAPRFASRWTVFPGVDGWAEMTWPAIDGGMVNDLKAGRLTCVVAGYIVYRDIFGKRHISMFRHWLLPDSIQTNGYAKVAAATRGNRSS